MKLKRIVSSLLAVVMAFGVLSLTTVMKTAKFSETHLPQRL